MLNAKFDTMLTPMSIDVSTGDAITPHAVQYIFSEIFDDEKSYELWAYNIETVMAEKVETILRRGVFSTRPRDFYDAYILMTTQEFDMALFADALKATAAHRGTTQQIADVPGILQNIAESPELRLMWEKYRKQFSYAERIEYAINCVLSIVCESDVDEVWEGTVSIGLLVGIGNGVKVGINVELTEDSFGESEDLFKRSNSGEDSMCCCGINEVISDIDSGKPFTMLPLLITKPIVQNKRRRHNKEIMK